MELKNKNKTPSLISKIGVNGLSINQLGNESNSLEIGSQEGRVNTHYAMDKQKLSKMPKAN